MLKKLISAIAALVCFAGAAAQTGVDWNVDLYSVFDNSEGSNDLMGAETVFFTRLTPTVGFRLTDGDRIAGGIDWTRPIANDWNGKAVRPVLYYRHDKGHWSGSFGIFPRTQLIEQLPDFLWNDSLVYFQPNIRGALLQWRSQRSFAEIYLDWRQKQTETRRESFNITAHGRWQHPERPWLGGAYLTMNHLALTKNAPDDMHIVDNFMAAPYVGGDFSSATVLDSLRVRAGLLMTIERNRAVGDWKTPAGGWLEFYGAYKGFSLKNMFYCGSKLFPSLDTFGSLLYQGDACYDAHYYDLVELGYSVVSTRNVDLGAELDFHFSPEGFMSCQKISLTITFGSAYPLKFR